VVEPQVPRRQDRAAHRRGPLRPFRPACVKQARRGPPGIGSDVGCHSCRATGITNYPLNGGTLERAAAIAGHASTRTTQLYDRRRELVEPDEIERVKF